MAAAWANFGENTAKLRRSALFCLSGRKPRLIEIVEPGK
jgi:hypothetical protein